MQVKGLDSQLSLPGRPRMLMWSLLVGLVAGLFGVSAPTALFGVYMETPPPLLGQPFSYQTIQSCSKLVCAPVALNSPALALADYAIYFAVGFLVTFAFGIIFVASHKPRSWFGRNVVPLALFIIAVLVVAVAAGGSVANGASLTQPHWPTPSGVEVYALTNVTLYSGTATTASLQGTAHLDITFINYYWNGESIPANITLTAGNGTVISSVYRCPTPSSCTPLTTIEIPNAYSTMTFDQQTTAFYFGAAVVKGQSYSLAINMPGIIMHFGTGIAQ
jgi:hypothetical protein